jgi:hypothetical protein
MTREQEEDFLVRDYVILSECGFICPKGLCQDIDHLLEFKRLLEDSNQKEIPNVSTYGIKILEQMFIFFDRFKIVIAGTFVYSYVVWSTNTSF